MNKQPSREAYYKEAESWNRDRFRSLQNSRNIAWIIAGVAVAVALFEALALMLLMPLKTVEPYTLMVDRQTGFVQALEPLAPERVTADTALTQSFLVQYVIARENFDANALQANYRKVTLWSAETARSNYIARMQASHPESPLSRYPRSTLIETRVKSVSPVGQNTVMVRFETQRVDRGSQPQPPVPWAAVIRYRYSGEPMRAEDRYLNPLGFQVVHYRRDAETIEAPPSGTAYVQDFEKTAPGDPQ